jgi:tetratricopeptide (TPR) repeat protein
MEMLCRYEDAIADYKKSFEIEKRPRFIDAPVACAQIYEHLKDYSKAIEMRRLQIDVLKQEWNILSGESIDAPLREIERLKLKLPYNK